MFMVQVLLNSIMMEMIWHMHSHGEEILKNYLIPRAMLSSRVDGDSHIWIDAGNRGKTDELIWKKKKRRRSHSAPPFYQGKKKFFATSESSRKAAGNKNIKTVHDVPLMPETRAVRRLHHSVEAIYLELHGSHPINVINLPP